MTKIISGVALALALLVVAAPAYAATFTNVQFSNGDVTISGQGGSTVQATFHVVVPAGQTIEWIRTDVLGDNLSYTDQSVGGEMGLQEGEYDLPVSIKLPPNTGTYSVSIQGAGTFGGFRSISGGDSVVGTATFSNAVRVVSGTTSVGGDTSSLWALFQAWLNGQSAGVPAATTSTKCTELATKLVGTQYGVKNAANVKLQGYLLSEGYDIPALAQGAAFGLWLTQTQAALNSFKTANSCK